MIHSEDGERKGNNNPGCTNSQRQRGGRGGEGKGCVGALYRRYRPALRIRESRENRERKERKRKRIWTERNRITDIESERDSTNC